MRHEPILNYDFPLDETAAEGVWHQASRYSVWMGGQSKGAPPYQMVERHAEGFVRLPPRPRPRPPPPAPADAGQLDRRASQPGDAGAVPASPSRRWSNSGRLQTLS